MSAAASENDAIATIERAMIALQRIQSRRRPLRGRAETSSMPVAMYQVLDAVVAAAAVDKPLTVTGLGTAMNVDQPRASRLVADAVAAGMVRRKADPVDGRLSVLALTEHGTQALAEARRRRCEALASVLADWPAEDREVFSRLFPAFVRQWENHATRGAS